ncbi:MAG: hypothetical protein IJ480_05890 [Clostridia bacterium]|nr:hypothetical protein [Clostridia bacterium]
MKHRLLTILLAAMLTAPLLASCASDAPVETADTTAAVDTAADETEPGWEYPDVDYQGGEYRILNFDQLWNMYIHMDSPELTGEPLNDAVYNRNRAIEDELNCVIIEKELECDSANTVTLLTDEAKTSIMSGSDDYDVMFLPIQRDISLVTEGYLLDLMAIPQLQLNETWWDQDVIDATTLKGKLYFATGAINLMAYDSMWCLFFNENMMEDRGMEKPYDLVREGKWTIEALTEYCSQVANLNDDTSYTWNKDGSCIWGISSHQNAPEKFYFSSMVRCAKVQDNGEIAFTLEDGNFYDVIDKLAILLNGKSGNTLMASNTDFDVEAGGYVHVFTVGRAMFMTGEIKAAQLMRDMEDTFGIVPFPKADETQENYSTNLVDCVFCLSIPTTNTKLEQTAVITEVLAHDSHTKVIPLYYETIVEHKGLRNEDSIEMLDIMRATRDVDIAIMFNWYDTTMRYNINTKLFNGDNQIASTVAANKNGINTNIEKFMEYLNK